MAWTGSEDEFEDFIEKYGLTFPQISDDAGEIFARFEIPVQPGFAIVRPDGEVQTILGAADDAFLDFVIEDALA